MPPCDKEGQFRDAMSKVNADMAALSVALSKMAQELEECVKLESSCAEALVQGQPLQIVCEHAKMVAKALTSMITTFACVTLVRSPLLGGKSEDSKKMAKQLQSLLLTALNHELSQTPQTIQLPDAAVEKLLLEIGSAVWRAKIHI